MGKTFMTSSGLQSPLPIGNSSFERTVRSLLEKGERDMGKAILMARQNDGEAYNKWVDDGRRFTFEKVSA